MAARVGDLLHISFYPGWSRAGYGASSGTQIIINDCYCNMGQFEFYRPLWSVNLYCNFPVLRYY